MVFRRRTPRILNSGASSLSEKALQEQSIEELKRARDLNEKALLAIRLGIVKPRGGGPGKIPSLKGQAMLSIKRINKELLDREREGRKA